jgi:hypothetical protein
MKNKIIQNIYIYIYIYIYTRCLTLTCFDNFNNVNVSLLEILVMFIYYAIIYLFLN